VLQVQHGVQHDARAAKAPPRVHGSSSFTVRLFINPPFLQCSKCRMENNRMHELQKHRRVHGSSSFTVRLFINPPFLQCSKCSMEYNTMHELRKHRHVCPVHRHLQCACSFKPPFLQCSKCSMEYNTIHELRKHRPVLGSSLFTVRLFINPPLFTVLQVQHGVQHDARVEKAPPRARVTCAQAVQYLWRALFLTGQLFLFYTVTVSTNYSTVPTRYISEIDTSISRAGSWKILYRGT
jgi:hypothetical protein